MKQADEIFLGSYMGNMADNNVRQHYCNSNGMSTFSTVSPEGKLLSKMYFPDVLVHMVPTRHRYTTLKVSVVMALTRPTRPVY